MDSGLFNAVKTAYLDCLNLKKTETVLVLTDEETYEVGHAFFEVGQSLAASAHLFLMPVAKVNGEEPPATIAELMGRAHAHFYYLRKGIVMAFLPDIQEERLTRLLNSGIGGIRDLESVKCLHIHFCHFRVFENNIAGLLTQRLLKNTINCDNERCALKNQK